MMKLIEFFYIIPYYILVLLAILPWILWFYYEKSLLKKEQDLKTHEELMGMKNHKSIPEYTSSTYTSEQRKKLFKWKR